MHNGKGIKLLVLLLCGFVFYFGVHHNVESTVTIGCGDIVGFGVISKTYSVGNAIPVGCSITSGLRVKSSTFVTEYQKCFPTTMVGPQKNRKRAIQRKIGRIKSKKQKEAIQQQSSDG